MLSANLGATVSSEVQHQTDFYSLVRFCFVKELGGSGCLHVPDYTTHSLRRRWHLMILEGIYCNFTSVWDMNRNRNYRPSTGIPVATWQGWRSVIPPNYDRIRTTLVFAMRSLLLCVFWRNQWPFNFSQVTSPPSGGYCVVASAFSFKLYHKTDCLWV